MKNRVAALSKKQCVQVDHDKHTVFVLKNPVQSDLGNKSWGTIDYITNQGGYKLEFVSELPKKKWETSDTLFSLLISPIEEASNG